MPTTLTKQQRLKGELQISHLFKSGRHIIAYPLRICYLSTNSGINQMMVRVPKKIFKRAVKRNLLKRRIREAYRLNQDLLNDYTSQANTNVQIAFTYIASEVLPFEIIQKSVVKAFSKIKL